MRPMVTFGLLGRLWWLQPPAPASAAATETTTCGNPPFAATYADLKPSRC
jgi:hypothetical protein